MSETTTMRHALSDHDTVSPLTPDEMRTLAKEMADALVEHECNFSHPDWRYVDGLYALAARLTELERDRARLDWLESQGESREVWLECHILNPRSLAYEEEGPRRWRFVGQGLPNNTKGSTARDAIDAASPSPVARVGEAPAA